MLRVRTSTILAAGCIDVLHVVSLMLSPKGSLPYSAATFELEGSKDVTILERTVFNFHSAHTREAWSPPHGAWNAEDFVRCSREGFKCLDFVSPTRQLFVAMTSWNETADLERALTSIVGQKNLPAGSTVTIVVFEDLSEDMLSDAMQMKYMEKMRDGFRVVFLRRMGDNLDPKEPSNRLGAAGAKWALFQWLRDASRMEDYVMVMDGDDVLADSTSLGEIMTQLFTKKPWFAWGRINGMYEEQCGPLKLDTPAEEPTIRQSTWSFCHPRSFRARLLRSLTAEEFQREPGVWLDKATDRPFVYRFMEMAGPDRILYMGDRARYNYSFGEHNGLKLFSEDVINGDKQLMIGRPPFAQESADLYVVSCTWERPEFQQFLRALVSSGLPEHARLYVHICNNLPTAQEERQRVAAEEANKTRFEITVHDMGGNMGGFARFLLAQKLMRTSFVEYVIMIDDDELVRPGALWNLYSQRQPLTYKTWYGKNWAKGDTYWACREPAHWQLRDDALTHPNVTRWQYGATSFAIIDADFFAHPAINDIPCEYLFIEDMWLSYVVHATGGEIHRISFNSSGPFAFGEIEKLSVSGQYQGLVDKKEEFLSHLQQCTPNFFLLDA